MKYGCVWKWWGTHRWIWNIYLYIYTECCSFECWFTRGFGGTRVPYFQTKPYIHIIPNPHPQHITLLEVLYKWLESTITCYRLSDHVSKFWVYSTETMDNGLRQGCTCSIPSLSENPEALWNSNIHRMSSNRNGWETSALKRMKITFGGSYSHGLKQSHQLPQPTVLPEMLR